MHWQRLAARSRRTHWAISFWISLLLTARTICPASPIATPTPAPSPATTIVAPAANPLPFNFGPYQVLGASELMSDFYAIALNQNSLVAALNATGSGAYACGPCVTSIVAGSGISVSPSAQVSGAGYAVTISVSPMTFSNSGAAITGEHDVVLSGTTPATSSAACGPIDITTYCSAVALPSSVPASFTSATPTATTFACGGSASYVASSDTTNAGAWWGGQLSSTTFLPPIWTSAATVYVASLAPSQPFYVNCRGN